MIASADPVGFYNEQDRRIPRALSARLTDLRNGEVESLANNFAKTFDDYRHRTGRIAALDEAIRLCQEFEKEFGQR